MPEKAFKKRFSQLFWAFGSLLLSLLFGSVGYRYFEGYDWVDSLYMAGMVISTVGFGEVKELSHSGKIFSTVYFFINICLFAYVVAVLSKYLFEGELRDIFTKYMLGRQVNKLQNHVIICGLGRNGYRAAMELKRENVPFVVVEVNLEVIKKAFGEENSEYYIIGDATDERVLEQAGIHKARALMACIPKDSTNVFVTLTAREMNPNLKIIARAIFNGAESKLKTAGADFVVNPDEIGGNYMATLVHKPEIIEFLDLLMGEGKEKLKLEEYSRDDYREEFKNKSLREMGVELVSRITFVCHKSKIGGYEFNPGPDTKMEEGDFMIILGQPNEVESFKRKFLKSTSIAF